MSYADILNGQQEEIGLDPSQLPPEVAAVSDQFSQELRLMMARGEIRFEVIDGPDGKTILLVHEDPLSPKRIRERLPTLDTLKIPGSPVEKYRRHTKFEMHETMGAETIEPFRYDEPRPSRNDRCGCHSGKKYKQCCMRKTMA